MFHIGKLLKQVQNQILRSLLNSIYHCIYQRLNSHYFSCANINEALDLIWGLILGFLLWLIYINDLVLSITVSFLVFFLLSLINIGEKKCVGAFLHLHSHVSKTYQGLKFSSRSLWSRHISTGFRCSRPLVVIYFDKLFHGRCLRRS